MQIFWNQQILLMSAILVTSVESYEKLILNAIWRPKYYFLTTKTPHAKMHFCWCQQNFTKCHYYHWNLKYWLKVRICEICRIIILLTILQPFTTLGFYGPKNEISTIVKIRSSVTAKYPIIITNLLISYCCNILNLKNMNFAFWLPNSDKEMYF